MKITKELRVLSDTDLKSRLGEFKKELLKLNVEVATGANPSSPGRVKQTKKNIARILTLLKEKQNEVTN
jgi:large subunit ribosomal protein L29